MRGLSVSIEEISAFLLAFDNGIGTKPAVDVYWLPKPTERREAYTDGLCLLPPEVVRPGPTLPPNVIQHHGKAGDLVAATEKCPLCELFRMACILDAFRERGCPFDHSKKPLANILASIRLREGSSVFERIIWELRYSTDPIFLMFYHRSSFDHTVPTMVPYISPRQPLRSSGSLDAFNLLRSWLQGGNVCGVRSRENSGYEWEGLASVVKHPKGATISFIGTEVWRETQHLPRLILRRELRALTSELCKDIP